MDKPRMAAAMAAALAALLIAALPAVADDRTTCERASGAVAIAACDRAIESGQFSGIALAKLHTNRGVERKGRGDLDGAIKDYDIAIGLNPSDHFAFNNRANARRDNGDLAGAIADYGEAVRIDRDYAAAYVNRGLLYERQRDLERARADFRAALAAAPHKYNNSGGAHRIARERLTALGDASP